MRVPTGDPARANLPDKVRFNLSVEIKLQGCELLDTGDCVSAIQNETRRPFQFKLTKDTRADYLPSRRNRRDITCN